MVVAEGHRVSRAAGAAGPAGDHRRPGLPARAARARCPGSRGADRQPRARCRSATEAEAGAASHVCLAPVDRPAGRLGPRLGGQAPDQLGRLLGQVGSGAIPRRPARRCGVATEPGASGAWRTAAMRRAVSADRSLRVPLPRQHAERLPVAVPGQSAASSAAVAGAHAGAAPRPAGRCANISAARASMRSIERRAWPLARRSAPACPARVRAAGCVSGARRLRSPVPAPVARGAGCAGRCSPRPQGQAGRAVRPAAPGRPAPPRRPARGAAAGDGASVPSSIAVDQGADVQARAADQQRQPATIPDLRHQPPRLREPVGHGERLHRDRPGPAGDAAPRRARPHRAWRCRCPCRGRPGASRRPGSRPAGARRGPGPARSCRKRWGRRWRRAAAGSAGGVRPATASVRRPARPRSGAAPARSSAPARSRAPISITTAFRLTGPSATLNRVGRCVRKRGRTVSRLKPMIESRGPVMPMSLM